MTTLERLENLEKELKAATEQVTKLTESKLDESLAAATQISEMVAQRVIGLEQAHAAIAKTLRALVTVLHNTDVAHQDSVMKEIRKGDDEADKEQVSNLIQQKSIVRTDQVKPASLVVVQQSFISAKEPAKSGTFREYSLIELPMPTIPPQLRQDLTGRKIGDSIPTTKKDEGVFVMTVKEIYDVLPPPEVTNKGEEQAAPAGNS